MKGMLERDRELSAIDRRCHALAAGEGGGVVLVVGEAGIGKSALLSGARVRAEEMGIRVFRASGAALEREFGFGVVRQLLEREVRALPSSERERVFAGAAGPAASVLGLPARERVPVSETDPAFSVRHALVWVLEALAERGPVAVVVDDLQSADGTSLRWLADLAWRIEEMPVLVLGALRTGEQPTAPEAVTELEAAEGQICYDRRR